MRNIKKRLPFLFLLLFTVLVLACSKGESAKSKSDPNAPVSLTLTDEVSGETITFKIPPDYLTYEKQKHGKLVREKIWVETGLPDMSPRKAKNNVVGQPGSEEYKKSIEEFNNGIFLDISSDRPVESSIDNARKMYRQIYLESDSPYPGLIKYQDLLCRGGECVSRGFEHYLTTAEYDERWARLRCVTEIEMAGCSTDIVYKGWRATYTFRKSELYRWQEFDFAVRAFLERFYFSSN